jgi:hypothetical protein
MQDYAERWRGAGDGDAGVLEGDGDAVAVCLRNMQGRREAPNSDGRGAAGVAGPNAPKAD